jgi:hypothetical protein
MKSIVFWDMTPYSPLSVNRLFRGIYRLHLQGRRNKFSKKPLSKQVLVEAICSSETSVDTQRTTRRHIPGDDTLHNHRCENLKTYFIFSYFTVNYDSRHNDVDRLVNGAASSSKVL